MSDKKRTLGIAAACESEDRGFHTDRFEADFLDPEFDALNRRDPTQSKRPRPKETK